MEYELLIATRCRILRLTCTKFDFGWGLPLRPRWGAYSAPPDLLAGIRVLLLRGEVGREGRGKVVRGVEGKGA